MGQFSFDEQEENEDAFWEKEDPEGEDGGAKEDGKGKRKGFKRKGGGAAPADDE